MTSLFPLFSSVIKTNGHKLQNRGKKNKEGFYFGPFASAGTANWTIKMLQKIFQLRVCDDSTFKNRKRPCILYQIKRCSGPCVDYINKVDYEKSVDQAIQFVSGKSRDIQKNLSKQMEKASEKLDFERASIFRDRIKSLLPIKNLVKLVFRYFFIGLNKIGATKLIFQNTTLIKMFLK
jgi:excinuclease UvrABC nuclease subunit